MAMFTRRRLLWAALPAAVVLVAVWQPAPVFRDALSLHDAGIPARVRDGVSFPGSAGAGERAGETDGPAADAVPPEMRQQMADVARAYAENARFPGYSTPLGTDDWAQLHPRAFVARSAALRDMPGVTATIVLDHYIADRGLDLPVQVQVSGEPGAAPVTAVGVMLKRQGQSSALVPLAPAAGDEAGSGQVFVGLLPVSALRSVAPGESVVAAEVAFANGQRALVTAMVKLYESTANLVGVGEARVEGANLVIPVRFDVRAAGYYRVEANLFAAGSHVPVSHVTAEFPLAEGQGEGMLKVHAVTLREKGAAGPYVLRDIDITRQSDQPGDPVGHGSALATAFNVRGYPLDAYSNEPWEDPGARQRLEFLQKLAGAH